MRGRKKGGNLIFLSSYRLPGISIIGHSKPFSILLCQEEPYRFPLSINILKSLTLNSFLPERREGIKWIMCLIPSYCLPGQNGLY
jgi:hypothetical protein